MVGIGVEWVYGFMVYVEGIFFIFKHIEGIDSHFLYFIEWNIVAEIRFFRNISIYEIFLNYISRHAEIYYLVFFLVESILFWVKDGFSCSDGLSLYNILGTLGLKKSVFWYWDEKFKFSGKKEGERTNEFLLKEIGFLYTNFNLRVWCNDIHIGYWAIQLGCTSEFQSFKFQN